MFRRWQLQDGSVVSIVFEGARHAHTALGCDIKKFGFARDPPERDQSANNDAAIKEIRPVFSLDRCLRPFKRKDLQSGVPCYSREEASSSPCRVQINGICRLPVEKAQYACRVTGDLRGDAGIAAFIETIVAGYSTGGLL